MHRAALGLASLAVLALGACATVQRYDAAWDVHAFLVAVRDGDRAAFEAHVDRPALREQLRSRIAAGVLGSSAAPALKTLGLALSRPAAGAAADALVQPASFRTAARLLGYDVTAPLPPRAVIAKALRPLDRERVCVTRSDRGPCLFIFKLEGDAYRLIGFEGDLADLPR